MILLNIIDKAISGGLSALLVFLIYWGLTTVLRRLRTGKKNNSEIEKQKRATKEKIERNQSAQNSHVETGDLPDPNRCIVKFNYFYSFRWVPECINAYNSGKGDIMKAIDIISLSKLHPEYSSVSRKLEYALSQHNSSENIKALAISVPNSGSISEVEVGYIVFDETIHKSVYFTLEKSFDGLYAIVSPDIDGNRSLYGNVKNHSDFIELALSVALKYFDGESAKSNKAQNQETRDTHISKTNKTSVNGFESLTGIAKSRMMAEIGEIIKTASDVVSSSLGQVPIMNESICYLFCSSFLLNNIPSKFLLEIVSDIRQPFFNEWTQRSILSTIEKLNNTLPTASIPLVDFARVKGNMRIETGIRVDGEYGKYATFKKANDELSLIEAIFDLPEENIKAEYISKIRNELRIKKQDGIYIVYHNSDDKKAITNYNQRIYYLLYTDDIDRLQFTKELPSDYIDYITSDAVIKGKVDSIYGLHLEIKNLIQERLQLLDIIN